MRYIVLLTFLIGNYVFADPSGDRTTSTCTTKESIKPVSPGFVLVLKEGKQFLLCAPSVNIDGVITYVWVEVEPRFADDKNFKLKDDWYSQGTKTH